MDVTSAVPVGDALPSATSSARSRDEVDDAPGMPPAPPPNGPEPSLGESLDPGDLADRDSLVNRWGALGVFGALLLAGATFGSGFFSFSGFGAPGFLLATAGFVILFFLVVPLHLLFGEEWSLSAGMAAIALIVPGALTAYAFPALWVPAVAALVGVGTACLVVGGTEALRYSMHLRSVGLDDPTSSIEAR